jgi:hypothetical protein
MIIALALTVISLVAVVCLRTVVLFKVQMRRLIEIHDLAQRLIDQGKPWEHLYQDFDLTSSGPSQLLDLTKWTYRQFYKPL